MIAPKFEVVEFSTVVDGATDSYRTAYAIYRNAFGKSQASSMSLKDFTDRYSDDKYSNYLARFLGCYAGFAMIDRFDETQSGDDSAFIDLFAVKNPGCGYGSVFLQLLEEQLSADGINTVELTPNSAAAIMFYENHDYRQNTDNQAYWSRNLLG